jgi:transposase InsO family protein
MLDAIAEARAAGCDAEEALRQVGVCSRTVARWRKAEGCGDQRRGSRQRSANALSEAERNRLLRVVNSPEFRDCSPKQIVPRLADRGEYLASESTVYRILRQEEQLAHREPSKVRVPRPIPSHEATGPNQVYSWDITYLPGAVRGTFFFLYLFIDIWSRKVVGWAVHREQSERKAADLFKSFCAANGVDPKGIVLHSDNGGPMKGTTMLQMLQDLGVIPSFSRPSVSDDNAYSESIFKTLKFRPGYPGRFASIEAARAWVATFVAWYDNQHCHSGIRYVTPAQRHEGLDVEILRRRDAVYKRAQALHPERWSGATRNWKPIGTVRLNSRQAAA